MKTKRPKPTPCKCKAYPFPHRLFGGKCEGGDDPQDFTQTNPRDIERKLLGTSFQQFKGGISDGKAVLDWVERGFSCDIEDISVNEMVIQLGLNLFRLVKYRDAASCTRGAVIRAMKERGSRNVLFDFSTLVFRQKQQ